MVDYTADYANITQFGAAVVVGPVTAPACTCASNIVSQNTLTINARIDALL